MGMGPTFATMVIAATAGVSDNEQGLASGVFTTTQQVGSGLELAIVVAISSAHTAALLQHGANADQVAFTAGLQYALFACAGFALLAALAALFAIREKKYTSDVSNLALTEDNSGNRPTPPQPLCVGKEVEQRRE